jgi:hypothetical protein
MVTILYFLDLWLYHLFLHSLLFNHNLQKLSGKRMHIYFINAYRLYPHTYSTHHFNNYPLYFRIVFYLLHCRILNSLSQSSQIRRSLIRWKNGSLKSSTSFLRLLQLIFQSPCWINRCLLSKSAWNEIILSKNTNSS